MPILLLWQRHLIVTRTKKEHVCVDQVILNTTKKRMNGRKNYHQINTLTASAKRFLMIVLKNWKTQILRLQGVDLVRNMSHLLKNVKRRCENS